MDNKNKPIDREKFCYYPFTQMVLQPNGQISPCCNHQNLIVGQVPEQTIQESWNGEIMRQLRREFIEGKPVLCEMYMRHKRCHFYTEDSVWKDRISLSEVQSNAPQRLDVRLNGRCNLSCVMCGVWTQPNGLYNDSDLWTYGPQKIFPNLIEIDVLGGEPFIQKDTYRLISEISKINDICTWSFVTNANFKFNEIVRNHLDKIKIRWISISLDSVRSETYAQIRVGGDLDKALKTMDDFILYRNQRQAQQKDFGLGIAMCVQKKNWREIEEFIQFARLKKINLILQFAYIPEKECLLSLSKEERLEIVDYFEKISGLYDEELIRPVLMPLKESLM